MVANEQDVFAQIPEARQNYRIQVGSPGDGAFVRQWHGRERIGSEPGARTMRWSTSASQLHLPVEPGRPYRVTIELSAPREAISPEAGLYLDGRRIATIQAGVSTVTADLPATQRTAVTLELRCRGWVPRDVLRESHDDRTLGVSVYSVAVQAKDAPTRVFNANLGEWLDTAAATQPAGK
ncbi:MAG: hypothetical protein ABSH20_11905 [Tepidisphaeraceae bacterium]